MKKKRKGPKKIADLKRHFLQRLATRYGIEVEDDTYDVLNRMIQDNRGKLLFRESHTRTHFLLEYQGQTIVVVYNSKLSGLVTALPISALELHGITKPNIQ